MPTTGTSTNLAISGLASGFDWQSLVAQLVAVERAPETRLLSLQNAIQQRNNAYGSINTQLGVLSNRAAALNDPNLFDSRLAGVGEAITAKATASTGAPLGSYTFNFTQLATAAAQQGAVNAGRALSATNDVSGLVLSDAGFATGITGGTFTVNGQSVTISTTDTLQAVFDRISTATGGAVTASYESTTDKISLSGSGPIILGSATDTSNFLQASKLFNNGTSGIESASALGSVKLGGTLAAANLATAISDGGAGEGSFKINGVAIAFSTGESLSVVLKRINDSAAGVTASYDAVNDRFQITNKAAGDVGISLEDVTGNFLAATGLSGGALQRGNNLLYNINGGGTLTSQSNTISEATSGLTGLFVTALKVGSSSVEVTSDNAKIKSAITGFVEEYNRSQTLIDTYTASTTDAKGKVTAGLLAGESDIGTIATSLRRIANATGLPGVINNLDSLGIVANGQDNNLSVADSGKLDSALANNLSAVRNLFSDASSGITKSLGAFLDRTSGDGGTLESHQTALTKQSTDIDKQIEDMERLILAREKRLNESFVAMELARARITQQATYLSQFNQSS